MPWSSKCLHSIDLWNDLYLIQFPTNMQTLIESDCVHCTDACCVRETISGWKYNRLKGTFSTIFACNLHHHYNFVNNKISDVGGSITVHAFGAYFGLAVSFMMRPKANQTDGDGKLEQSVYVSDLFAMIGTLFLWIFWPSFNSALLDAPDQQYRAIMNTYLSLTSATGMCNSRRFVDFPLPLWTNFFYAIFFSACREMIFGLNY